MQYVLKALTSLSFCKYFSFIVVPSLCSFGSSLKFYWCYIIVVCEHILSFQVQAYLTCKHLFPICAFLSKWYHHIVALSWFTSACLAASNSIELLVSWRHFQYSQALYLSIYFISCKIILFGTSLLTYICLAGYIVESYWSIYILMLITCSWSFLLAKPLFIASRYISSHWMVDALIDILIIS